MKSGWVGVQEDFRLFFQQAKMLPYFLYNSLADNYYAVVTVISYNCFIPFNTRTIAFNVVFVIG